MVVLSFWWNQPKLAPSKKDTPTMICMAVRNARPIKPCPKGEEPNSSGLHLAPQVKVSKQKQCKPLSKCMFPFLGKPSIRLVLQGNQKENCIFFWGVPLKKDIPKYEGKTRSWRRKTESSSLFSCGATWLQKDCAGMRENWGSFDLQGGFYVDL